MLFIERLQRTPENYAEMKAVCSDWEKKAESKIEESPSKEGALFSRYVSAKSVSEICFYRFRKEKLSSHFIDIVYDSDLNLLGFSVSKIITLRSSEPPREHKFLFLHYMTSNPHMFEVANRTKNIGGVILENLKIRCVEEDLQGIFTEPTLSAMSYFYRMDFVDTDLRRETPKDRTVPRKAIAYRIESR